MTIRTRFDGKKIILPKELAGHAPCDVEITVPSAGSTARTNSKHSIWEVVSRSEGTRNPDEILQESSRERDQWGDE